MFCVKIGDVFHINAEEDVDRSDRYSSLVIGTYHISDFEADEHVSLALSIAILDISSTGIRIALLCFFCFFCMLVVSARRFTLRTRLGSLASTIFFSLALSLALSMTCVYDVE